MTEDGGCPVCGERLSTKGLSFLMITVVVDKHRQSSPNCRLSVELDPDDKSVSIRPAFEPPDAPAR